MVSSWFKWRILLSIFCILTLPAFVGGQSEGVGGGGQRATALVTLENGLRVVVQERPQTRTAALQIWVKVGSRDEPEGQHGVSHLLAHLILKGTRALRAEEIAARVASVGGQITGGTSQEYSHYAVTVPDTGYPDMLKLLLELITQPAFREEDLSKERQVVLAEIGRLKDIPESNVDELALREVFKGHPMANPVRGEPENLKNLGRDSLIRHYQTYYVPTHIVVVAVGNVKTEEVIRMVRENLGEWKRGQMEEPMGGRAVPYPEQPKRQEVSLGGILLRQAKILLAIRVMGLQDEERPAMEVLSSVLQLRLFDSIRETRGLAYVVSSDYIPLSDTGIWKIYVEARGEAENRTRQIIFEELKKIRTRALEATELKEAKEYLKGRFVRTQETNNDLALYVGERVLFDGLESEEVYFSKIEGVTPEEVQRVAARYIQEAHYNLVVLRPFSFIGKIGFLLKQVF